MKDKYIRGINLIKNNFSYFLFNAHSDVVHLTDSAGAVTKRYHYDAFGNEVSPNASDGNPWRYCGEYFDGETGTVYLRARYYDPGIGRFLTEDIYRGESNDLLSLNLYTYCKNNPILYSDSSGHLPYSTQRYDGTYGLYVSPHWLDGIKLIPGTFLPFFSAADYLGDWLAGFKPVSFDWGLIPSTVLDTMGQVLKENKWIPVAGYVMAAFDGWKHFTSTDYKAEEAIFNQLNSKAFVSKTRDLVDAKFMTAMACIMPLVESGDIMIMSGKDIFGTKVFDNKNKTYYAYDPLLDRNVIYHKDQLYFYSSNNKYFGFLKAIEDVLYEGVWMEIYK